MLRINPKITLPLREIEISQVRSAGPGGQHVNKVASAVHLRFDIRGSSLPVACKQLLLQFPDRRITKDGIVVIKSQSHRSFEKNRQEALQRLQMLISRALKKTTRRIPSKPTLSSRQKRLQTKTKHGQLKASRRKITPGDDQ